VIALVALAGVGVALTGCGSSSPSVGAGSGAGQQDCGGNAPVQAGVTSVPVTVTDVSGSKLVTVGVCVGKHGPYSFVVDTGSTMSIIDSNLAGTLGLHRTGVTALGGMGCAQSGTVVSAPAMSMGHIPMAAQSLVSASLSNWAGQHVDGVLGSDVLGRFGAVKLEKASLTVAQVQGPPPTRHELVIGKKGAAPPASLLTTKPVVTVPMNVVYGPGTIAAYTSVEVMGHGPNAFVVDTGSPTTTLAASLAASLHIASTGTGTPPGGIGCTSNVPTLGPTAVALALTSQSLSTLRSMPITGEQRIAITGGLGLDFVVTYGTIIVDYAGADLTIAHG
jgi:Aspartyl protease